MKTTPRRLIISFLLAALAQAASAAVLLTDNFLVSSNSQNVNQELGGRQSGPLAPAYYSGWQGQHQVGNSSTDVGQPGGATNSNFVLLASDGSFFSDLNIASVATGAVTIEFDLYMTGANNPNTDPTTWGAVTLRMPGDGWPIVGSGEFGFLARVNGGIHIWDGSGDGVTGGWDTPGFATNTHWSLTFSDLSGTGSAFAGNGSQVTFVNGTNTLGTVVLNQQLNSAGLRLGFRSLGNRYLGVDNLQISGSLAPQPADVHNFSFENETSLPGLPIQIVPTRWTAFNNPGPADFGSQRASGVDYSVFDPLAATADGTNYCYLNKFDGGGVGGIYQNMGALQTNTIYTLTVAIGSRQDRLNSPGIIQLVNGSDNTGMVLATGGGLPVIQDSWQDYSINFTNGATASGNVTIVLAASGAGTVQANFDNVRYSTTPYSAPIPPSLVTDLSPLNQHLTTGTPVTFSVTINGSLPLRYQWYNQGGPIGAATNASYAFNAATGTNGYYVVVTNIAGSVTSAVAQVISATNIVTVRNFSFEDGTHAGGSGKTIPVQWSDFLNNNFSTVDGGSFSVVNPLAPPADGNLFFAINEGPGDPTGGIYQDVGPLLPNTIYTLTVAIGRRADTGPGTGDWSPGILSLINGTNNTGALLATVTGHPAFQDSWEDFSVVYTNVSTTGHLTVALSVAGAGTFQGLLDNVRLTTAPAPVVIAPSFTANVSPSRQQVTTGSAVSFTVAVNGSSPLIYQWYNQGGPIGGATSSNYTFNAVAGTNNYYVVVTNGGGAITSAVAQVVSATNIVTVRNFSFEDGTHTGGTGKTIPVQWSDFLNNNFSAVDGGSFSVVNPLAPPADGNFFFAINEGPADPTGGIYQDVGALLPNTIYTLTVAIGRRADTGPGTGDWSPGILSLINGTDNSGTLLATVTGHPTFQDSWEDFSVTFTNVSTSGHLTVALAVAGADTFQGLFDNVRLTMAPGAAPLVAPTVAAPRAVGGNLIVTGTGGTPNAGYTWLSTTNLAAPNWVTNSTGTLDGAGAFSNSTPINPSQPVNFFRLRIP